MYFLPSVKISFLVFYLVAECRLPVHKQRSVLILSEKQTCQLSLSYSCPFVRTLICLIINQANQNPRNASPQPSRDSGDSLLTLLQELMIFLSVNKQLTEHQHHGMSEGNQHGHKTKVCDKS